ncbi:putative glutamine amidotransferase [compost metagenome]
MKVLIVSSSFGYDGLFTSMGHELVTDVASSDLVVFTGGADVTPHLYRAKAHKETGNDPRRDAAEQMIFDDALERGIPMVGICRGGQFLNVMSGGEMYQHVEKHCGPHEITDLHTGETVLVSSTHHQMMKPSKKGLLVASSTLGGSREWYDHEIFHKDVSKEDIEVVYYPHTKSLCFQPHPEFAGEHYNPMKEYFKGLMERFVYEQVEA